MATTEALYGPETKNGTITREQMREAKEAAVNQAAQEIQLILDEYGVELLAVPQIRDGRIVAEIKLANR